MTDAQRRLLCRIAVLAICAMPTLVVFNWVFFPRSIDQWQTEFSHVLRSPVAIQSVETPTPNQVLFHNVRVCDVETQSWSEFAVVHWLQTLNSQQFELADANLTLGQFTGLVETLWTQAPQIRSSPRAIELHIQRLTIRSDLEDANPGDQFRLHDCWVRLDPAAAQPRLSIEFFTEQAVENPVRWEAIFGDATCPTRWSLNTDEHALPCWLVARAWPSVARLGGRSWFKGFVSSELSSSSSAVDVSMLFLMQVDLGQLTADSDKTNPDRPSATIRLGPDSRCDILVQSGRFVDGRVESLDCQVQCLKGGQIAHRLLDSARQWLHIEVPETSQSEWIPFAQLAFGLEIRSGSLAVRGQTPNGWIARGLDQQPIAFATAASSGLAPHCLAACLADESLVQLPISAASLEVLSHLPMVR